MKKQLSLFFAVLFLLGTLLLCVSCGKETITAVGEEDGMKVKFVFTIEKDKVVGCRTTIIVEDEATMGLLKLGLEMSDYVSNIQSSGTSLSFDLAEINDLFDYSDITKAELIELIKQAELEIS